ncbi:MAG: DNRLRE domain-containing protein, partial [Anaerolineae bacterium]
RTLVRFSLAQIPANATVSQATLEFYVGGAWGYGDSVPIEVYRLAVPWAAATTTWNNQPASAEQHATISAPWALGGLTMDVTSLVQGWVSGAYPNEGLVLRGRESPLGWRLIGRSRTTTPPLLHVEYSYTPTFAIVGVADTFAVAPGQAVSLTVYADAVGGFSETVGHQVGT